VSADPNTSQTGTPERRRPHPAPVARMVLMIMIVLGVLVGFTLLVWLAVEVRKLSGDLRGSPTPADIQRAALLLRTLALIMSASLAGVAVWIGHFAWRVRAADVYPPPGSRHMHVKRVRRGAEAQRVARICFVLAALLLAAGCTLVPLVWELLERLGLGAVG
jgi:hypothetical protein